MSAVLFWVAVSVAFMALVAVVFVAVRTDVDANPYPGGNKANVVDSILTLAPFALLLVGTSAMRAMTEDGGDAMPIIVFMSVIGVSVLVFLAPPVRAARNRLDQHRRARDRNAGRLPD